MAAGVLTLAIEQGTTWAIDIVYKVNGVPKDITGYRFLFQIKNKPGGDLIVEADSTITNALLGKVRFSLPSTSTWLIPTTGVTYSNSSTYQYDVIMIRPNNTVDRLLNGAIICSPGVSKQ